MSKAVANGPTVDECEELPRDIVVAHWIKHEGKCNLCDALLLQRSFSNEFKESICFEFSVLKLF